MSDYIDDNHHNEEFDSGPQQEEPGSNGEPMHRITHLSGMYKDWFLDYASYVILERAVPHLNDGLKPVQRRILHTMRQMDDGRYIKVANIIGYTMQYHPHGDASIGEALVQLGQKDLLVDTQGNWGNMMTGDSSAAPRYIEARLSNFAREVVFNPKTTQWKTSYDGRNQEPITLPVKFPLLLAQGVEGIAVGLASKILPHNFNELIEAAIAYLKGESFTLCPDFPTGGIADFSRYNDGKRGGQVKIRARIEKRDKKALAITEIPFGKTTNSLIDSILRANDKGKIKVKRIDDNTAEEVEILIHLSNGTSPDKTIDALYAFTDCEVAISPNACVIDDFKPRFMGVSNMLTISVNNTRELLRQELEIRKGELQENWHMSSLEKIFIENRIYNDIEECETWKDILETIDTGLEPFKDQLMRKVTHDDLVKLTEIKIKRISKYDSKKADEYIRKIEKEIKDINSKLAKLTQYTIQYFQRIRKKFGKGKGRKTEIRNLEAIEATTVVEANEKLYVHRKDGFVGTGLKKAEYVGECSDIDEIIVFRKDGHYLITKVEEKIFVGKDILYVKVFKRNDERTIYNIIYRDGLNGSIMMKRCPISGITRDKEYDITKGTSGSRILYMSVNPDGEAEKLKVYLQPKPRLKKKMLEMDFSELAIKGRGAQGNILTRHAVHKIVLKEKGTPTLGGKKIWFDEEVLRLNTDGQGKYLGEFGGDDKIAVITNRGTVRFTSYDLTNHYEDEIRVIEKYNPDKVFSAIYFDADQGYFYVKRFQLEYTIKEASLIGENKDSYLLHLFEDTYPRVKLEFGGKNKRKEDQEVPIYEFIGEKSYKARGKRLTQAELKKIHVLDPLPEEEEKDEGDDADERDQMSLQF
ncbi:MAG: DNA gyrase/topoisomerase IV subunit A [Bacteroidales bacterium]|nr:DNA gyrase/topoisomerase IV subunit A [Bacteroidales bacterium]